LLSSDREEHAERLPTRRANDNTARVCYTGGNGRRAI